MVPVEDIDEFVLIRIWYGFIEDLKSGLNIGVLSLVDFEHDPGLLKNKVQIHLLVV